MAQHLPSLDQVADIFLLEGVKGFGPQKFKEIHEDRISISDLLAHPSEMQRFGKRGNDFRKQLDVLGSEGRQEGAGGAKRQLEAARSHECAILTYEDPNYPPNLYHSNLPLPAVYARGDLADGPGPADELDAGGLQGAPATASMWTSKPASIRLTVYHRDAAGAPEPVRWTIATGRDRNCVS